MTTTMTMMHHLDATHKRLLLEGYQQRVMDEHSYTLWRNAAASMMRIYDPEAVASLPLVYTPGMLNPLVQTTQPLEQEKEKEAEESMTENHPSPGIYQLLLAAEKLSMEDDKKKKPVPSTMDKPRGNRKLSAAIKNAKRNHPPAGPGLTAAEMNRLIANERTTMFSEGFWRVTAVLPSGIGKLVEVLRVYENGNTGSWSRWTPARIISFDAATHTLVVDPYVLDATFAGDEDFYLTYNTDNHTVRPIVFNYDTYYNAAMSPLKFEPQVHYCVHFCSPEMFRVRTHQLGPGKEGVHLACYERVLNERALHLRDITFEKRSD